MIKLHARFVPPGAVKIADKLSDAVAFIYTNAAGKPCARVFYGKQSKPVVACYYPHEQGRANAVGLAFEARRKRLAFMEARREARNVPTTLKVGDILNTCWGYEQTNREFFEVVGVAGKRDVILREVAQERVSDGWERGKCVPLPGQYVGEPIRRRANRYGVRIDRSRQASLSDTDTVGGVKVVRPVFWTSYH